MSKRDTIRVGDRVRIINDRPILRVGYPKAVKDYYEEIEKELGESVNILLREAERLGLSYRDISGKAKGVYKLIRHNLAYLRAQADGFGGTQRQIFFDKPSGRVDHVFEVAGIRRAVTGDYYSPTGGYYNAYTGDYDDGEPGGLADSKHHVILRLDTPWEDLEFLRSDCEKVQKSESEETYDDEP